MTVSLRPVTGRIPSPESAALRVAILAAIADHGAVTAQQARAMAAELGMRPGASSQALYRMAEEGQIARIDAAVYGPPRGDAPPAIRRTGRRTARYWPASARLTPTERAEGIALSDVDTSGRPTNRSECRGAARPCPWVSCRYHLALDVGRDGRLTVCDPETSVEKMTETCALDVADRGPAILDVIAATFSVTRERARQIEAAALARFREAMASGGHL